ncbi:hypothetical protein WN944_012188 [Citrus x changshan-huyou]|uniref:Uncharacterized protein n=1 Tax=Citrus x changshan-huyou TaxID=2935761 RepID=A0AAP0N161_9ROSI
MGCCISTKSGAPGLASKKQKHGRSDEASSQLKKGFSHESRASPPPPAIDQEETVKEVLSETRKPKTKPNPYPVFAAHMKQELQQQQEQEQEQEQEKEAKISDSPRKVEAFAKNAQDKQSLSSSNEEEIMSQVSEICSVSVSESLSTMTNVTDMRDIEEGEQEVRQRPRVITRSPAKPPPRNGFKRDRVVNQSPTTRSDQSPARRIGSASPVQIHDSGRVKYPGRRDRGECSGGRSRSPATTTRSSASPAFMGRSPSARRTNRSPGRASSVPIENATIGTTGINNNNNNSCSSGTVEGGKWASHNNNGINDHCSSTNESLENPLVSLECFIFL